MLNQSVYNMIFPIFEWFIKYIGQKRRIHTFGIRLDFFPVAVIIFLQWIKYKSDLPYLFVLVVQVFFHVGRSEHQFIMLIELFVESAFDFQRVLLDRLL